ncbi:MAG: methyltransferase domain-containing protein [Saprospiraceae bacterium]|nr:methyltransferase domain-containing protein [Saprospiraceae bacterium]
MWKSLKTVVSFTRHLTETGAFSETSRFVEREISKHVDPGVPQYILEYGAGHGNITRHILSKMHPESRLVSFEINPDFCELLRKINDPRLRVVEAPVNEVFDSVVPEEGSVDVIISSVPFTFLTPAQRIDLLEKSAFLLRPGGWMSQVLYLLTHFPLFKRFFPAATYKWTLNVPPAYVYHCQHLAVGSQQSAL